MRWEQKGFAVVSKIEISDGGVGTMPFFHDFFRTEWEAKAKKEIVEALPEELRKDLVILPCKLIFDWTPNAKVSRDENDKQESADKRVGSTVELGACGHFCEACARRDDEIKRLRDWLRDIHILMRNAYGNSSFHPRVANMAKTALDGAAPNAALEGRGE